MSAKPRFKPRVAAVVMARIPECPVVTVPNGYQGQKLYVTDARDLTAEQAVEKVLQVRYDLIPQGLKKTQGDRLCEHAKAAGMTALVVNGKVRVRRVEQ